MKRIPLSRGLHALVDDGDFERLSHWKWCALKANSTFYAVRNGPKGTKPRTIYMHGEILGRKGVDHKNGDGLDNQRENLRAANQKKNGLNVGITKRNRSGHKGICWLTRDRRWRARFSFEGRLITVGHYKENELEKATADYRRAVLAVCGEFAHEHLSQHIPAGAA